MTNGDGIRQLNNEDLAYLICGFIVLSKKKINSDEIDLDDFRNNKEYQLLLNLFNERIVEDE